MAINRSGRGLKPNAWRLSRLLNRRADGASRVHSRFENAATISRFVTAVHTAAGEIDDDIGGIEFRRPRPGVSAVPQNNPRVRFHCRPSAQNNQLMFGSE